MNAGAARAHQPGQAIFRAIPPEERLAVLVGDPAQPGPYYLDAADDLRC